MAELETVLPDGNPLITLEAVADLNEVRAVQAENERRAHKAAERKAKKRRG